MIPGLVSTIVPVYNRAAMLSEAVESVLAQTYRPIEIIIVDDGSTDDTRQMAEALQRRYVEYVRVISQENGGPGVAREKGRGEARGEFIQYLDSDDLLFPEKFARQVDGLRANPDCGISYGKTLESTATERSSDVPSRRTGHRLDRIFPSFLVTRGWNTVTPLYRREICEQVGPWSTLRQEEDWEYDARFGALDVKLDFCEHFIAEQRHHDEDRLCNAWTSNPEALKNRCRSRALIAGHAQRAGVATTCPEMRLFVRGLFLLARQCGQMGATQESRSMLDLARSLAVDKRWQFAAYGATARIVGWERVAKLSGRLDYLRS